MLTSLRKQIVMLALLSAGLPVYSLSFASDSNHAVGMDTTEDTPTHNSNTVQLGGSDHKVAGATADQGKKRKRTDEVLEDEKHSTPVNCSNSSAAASAPDENLDEVLGGLTFKKSKFDKDKRAKDSGNSSESPIPFSSTTTGSLPAGFVGQVIQKPAPTFKAKRRKVDPSQFSLNSSGNSSAAAADKESQDSQK